MKVRSIRGYLCAAVVAAIAATPAMAQATQTSQGAKQGRYNPATETTISGTVQQVTTPARGPEWATVQTSQGTFHVALAPSSFLQEKNVTIAKGDQIQVTGSKITTKSGKEVIEARQIQKGGTTVDLRNAQGAPMWSQSMGMDGQAMEGMHGAAMYNPQTETTVSGTIENVVPYVCGRMTGVAAVVKTDQGDMDAQFGPSQFLQQNNLQVSKGQQVQITGSKVTLDGNTVLLARTVQQGGKTVALRNAQGMPLWAQGHGMHRGAPGAGGQPGQPTGGSQY